MFVHGFIAAGVSQRVAGGVDWNVLERVLIELDDFRASNIADEICEERLTIVTFGEQIRSPGDLRDAQVRRAALEEVVHGFLRVLLELLQEFQRVVGEPVDDVDADAWIDVMRERVFATLGRADGENVRRVELLEQGRRLARVHDEEQLVVAFLAPHLFDDVGQFDGGDLLVVLEFEEAIAAVAGHVDEDVRRLVREETLGRGCDLGKSVGEDAHEVLHGHVVATVVDFDVVAVDIDLLGDVVEDLCRAWIACIAGHVIG